MKKTALISFLLVITLLLTTLSGILAPLRISAAENAQDFDILEVPKLDDRIVDQGTTLDQMQSILPSKVNAKVKIKLPQQGQILHTAGFNAGDWTLIDKNNVIRLDGEKIAISGVSGTVKALSGGTYDNFVLETTLKGTVGQTNKNNFGVMLRANDVTNVGGDSYFGYYVGIGYDGGTPALAVGYADGAWHLFPNARIPISYTHGTDYKLKVMLYENTIAVWLDGKLMYTNETDLYDKGRVGIRTFGMLFECSSFEVRTPSAAEISEANVITTVLREVELDAWTCPEYDSNTPGTYIFKTTVKGTDIPVECKVRSRVPLEALAETLEALSYDNVSITDGFFRDYTKQMICKVIPTAIENVEKPTGGIPNIINAAKKNRGEQYGSFEGMFYVESDVHKVLEAMCYALSVDPMGDSDIIAAQADIQSKLDEWIPYYVDAQEESGYFNTYHTLNPNLVKYSDVGAHELYCMGHFMEAAIAHYNCTDGADKRLIDAAIKAADHLTVTFGSGEGQKNQIPGHQEIELALLRLADTVLRIDPSDSARAAKYVELSAFLLGTRGKGEIASWAGSSEYWQTHAKVEDQTEAVGHAVRAGYMYTAMADLSALDDSYKTKYYNALSALWSDVTFTKQYVTGGLGSKSSTESFGESYDLPNGEAYCETCASIANMMWNRSMSKIYAGSAFAEQIETDLYNTVLGCVSLDGKAFYYDNALSTEELRSEWFGTACCPPNLARTILSVGGYIYNVGSNSLYVNQYISNKATASLGGNAIGLEMISNMPKDGKVSLTLSMASDTAFSVYLRYPEWSDKVTVKINGTPTSVSVDKNGYIVLTDTWSDGDKIEIDFSMPVIFEESDKQVVENIGYVAVRRGPLVYCAEYADNSFEPSRAYIDTSFAPELIWTDSIDGKSDPYGVRDMYLIKYKGYIQGFTKDTPVDVTFIPFYARLNRDRGPMNVFVAKERVDKPLQNYAVPSASYTFWSDSVFSLKDGTDSKHYRWTSYYNTSNVVEDPWVQYTFDEPAPISGCRIWWYADGGGVRLPDSLEIYYKNAYTGDFVPVAHDEKFLAASSEGFITYLFDDVLADEIRVCIDNSTHAAGIVEWQLIEGDADIYDAMDDLSSRLDAAVSALDQKIDQNSTDITGEIARLEGAIDAARSALATADENTKTELEAKINNAKGSLENAIKAVSDELESAKNDLSSKISANTVEISSLKTSAQKLASDMENAKKLIEQLGNKDDELGDELDLLDGKLASVENSLKAMIEKVADDLTASETALKESIKANTDRIDGEVLKLKDNINKLNLLISNQNLAIHDRVDELEAATESALQTLKNAVDKISEELAKAIEELNKTLNDGDKANSDALASAIEKLNASISNAEKVAAASDGVLKSGLQDQIASAQTSLGNSIHKLKEELAAAKKDAENADAALKAELEKYVSDSLVLPIILSSVALAAILGMGITLAVIYIKKRKA